MSGDKGDANRQIKQMVNFILQEAHEKVNETRIRTESECSVEKQNLIQQGKARVREEYEQKMKDLEVEQRVNRSKAVGDARVSKMNARDALLEQLKRESIEKLAAFCKGPEYPNYVKKLIVQGLIKIEETTVEIQSRAEDKAIVARVLPEAIAEYRSVMAAAGHTGPRLNPTVTVSNNVLPSKSCNGGVVLTSLNNRIVLNQTVDERLLIAYTDTMPQVRKGLFTIST